MQLFLSVRKSVSTLSHNVQYFCSHFALLLVFELIYLFNIATTITEYIFSVYMISATLVIWLVYIVLIANNSALFELIDRVERVIDERKQAL